MVLTSDDGLYWTARSSKEENPFLNAVTYGNKTFLAVGSNGVFADPPNFFILTGWGTSDTDSWLYGATYGNGKFVVVGGYYNEEKGKDQGAILTSPDGENWTVRISGIDNTLNRVTYGNGIFVAVGDSGTIFTSTDGENWTVRTSGTNHTLNGVTYGNGIFVAVGGY